MRYIAMGAAAIALAVSGAYAQPGNGNGKGPDKAMNGGQGPGQAKGPKHAGKADHGPRKAQEGKGRKMAQADRGKPDKAMKAQGQGRGNGQGNAKNVNKGKPDRDADWRGPASAQGKVSKDRDRDRRGRDYDYDDDRRGVFAHLDERVRSKGLIDGCPPGLAKKNNGCMPPGLAKTRRYGYDSVSWWDLPGLRDGRYRYYDGNLVRLSDAGRIAAYYPLLGGALSVGNVWPEAYAYEPLPRYYESYYGLGSSYRYADNAIYRLDPETSAITSIAALLTGDTIRVGQPMPSGYSVYNVPYSYRDRYVDGPNAMYRYSDGYVYEIDPSTMLVASVIDLLI